jgi:hypothetical protein
MHDAKQSHPGTPARADGAHVIWAPSREHRPERLSIFLAGTTSATGEPDWRQTLVQALAKYPIDVFNPLRRDWDRTWREDFSDGRWAEQVEWELDMQDAADIVVFFFHGATAAPVSPLELGLCVRSGRAIVCALDGYSKRGNVEAVCGRYGAIFVRSEIELAAAVVNRLRMRDT